LRLKAQFSLKITYAAEINKKPSQEDEF